MKILGYLFALLVLGMPAKVKAQTVTGTDDKIKQVEQNLIGRIQIEGDLPQTIQQRMAYYKLSGVSIAVIHNYKIDWAKAYGWADVDGKRPATVNTLFQAASLSKSLNALGLLKLAQDNKLNLD